MSYHQEVWETFINVPSIGKLPEFLQKIADTGKGQKKIVLENPERAMVKARTSALEILAETLGEPWNQAKIEDFQLERISGGFTNQVFKCWLSEKTPVILKVEFPKSVEDKKREYGMVKIMADNNLGPKLLGVFPEGRIEELLDCRIITEDEMRSTKFAYQIGRKVAQVHGLPIEKEERRNELAAVMQGYFDRIRKSGITSFELDSVVETVPKMVTVDMLEEEARKVESYLNEHFSTPVQRIHNDLFMPNFLITKVDGEEKEPEKNITLIDYEFSMRTHRASDVITYCIDFQEAFEKDVTKDTAKSTTAFLKGYLEYFYETSSSLSDLKLSGNLAKDSLTILEEAQKYVPIWVYYWALWHVVCFVENNTQLDYERIYKDRVGHYFSLNF